jgi:ABC-2 type transport system ATP-binding protein
MAAEPVISVRELRKSYGPAEVVGGVTFDVLPGEIFGVLGRNGAGKTTTLEMIEGLRPIGGGTATVSGIDVAREPRRVSRSVGIQLQEESFFERLTLVELLGLFADLYSARIDAIALLGEVDLESKASSQVKKLSGGQKQRFGIAMALVNNPRVLFLDEPTTGLDPHARRRLWDLVRRLKERGHAIVLTTHYIEEAEALCDRVAIMDEGLIVALGTPRALLGPGDASLEDAFLRITGRDIRAEE